MNIKHELERTVGPAGDLQLNDVDINPASIRAVLINEVVPADPAQDFYGPPGADYMKTTLPLFSQAGADVHSIADILALGAYITNAVKLPKTEYAVDTASLQRSLPYLEAELTLFPNARVILLMGDVAKKAYNAIAKKATGKNAVPAVSTYKLRGTQLFCNGVRILPSYIMTGGNILIEKSKFQMASEDIAAMLELIR